MIRYVTVWNARGKVLHEEFENFYNLGIPIPKEWSIEYDGKVIPAVFDLAIVSVENNSVKVFYEI